MSRHTALLLCLLSSSYCLAQPFDCMIQARQMIEIRSPVEGLIESVQADRGDMVDKGQVLVTLESGPDRAALTIARSRAAMTGPVEAAKARVEFAKSKEKREADLYSQKFSSSSALDEARTERRLAESELRVAVENQDLAKLEVMHAEELLRLRTIKSPFKGIVVGRYLEAGEFATTNIKEPILRLAEVDPLYVEVVLPASMFGTVQQADAAEITEETSSNRYAARVTVVDRVIDGGSGTFGVRLELPNPDAKIAAGAKCQLHFLD